MRIYTQHTNKHTPTHTHTQACIMLLIATLVGLENSFLTSVDWEDFTQVSEPYRWYTAVYWVITTVSAGFTPALCVCVCSWQSYCYSLQSCC